MTLRTFLIAVVASGLLVLPEGSQAQTRAQARAQRRHPTSGTVKSVDAAGHTVVVSAGKPGKEQTVTVQVTEQTRIASGRQPAQLSDVAVGQRVRVVPVEGTEPGATRFTASQILLRKPKAPA